MKERLSGALTELAEPSLTLGELAAFFSRAIRRRRLYRRRFGCSDDTQELLHVGVYETGVHLITQPSSGAAVVRDGAPEQGGSALPGRLPVCAASAPDDRRAQFSEIAGELPSEPQWAAMKRGRHGAVERVDPPLECAASTFSSRAESATATHTQANLQLHLAVRTRASDPPACVGWNWLADGQQVAVASLTTWHLTQADCKQRLRRRPHCAALHSP
mmetsp:Transcript_63748/g.142193  ORF Transcript_63748/g.142193 Transcript_63748/m.142193 type:complete len:217 (+) Transcript_63748:214-864(+)